MILEPYHAEIYLYKPWRAKVQFEIIINGSTAIMNVLYSFSVSVSVYYVGVRTIVYEAKWRATFHLIANQRQPIITPSSAPFLSQKIASICFLPSKFRISDDSFPYHWKTHTLGSFTTRR